MKKFKSKKHIRIKFSKIVLAAIVSALIISMLKSLINLNILGIDVQKILASSNIQNEIERKNIIETISKKITQIDVNKPITILKNMMPYESPNIETIKFSMMENPKEPLIYIYNTHQTEGYADSYNVLEASYYLKEKLEQIGLKTLVEENKINDILKENNWNYNESYKASRINLEKIKNKYPSIKIFIDLHRDAVNKQSSTVTIDNKDYAKVLFVIGKEHNKYLKNLEYTKSIDAIIKEKYPDLTKGILEKEGIGVNGIYNQDIQENIILLEVGGNENIKEEVTNTIEIIAEVIKEKLK